MPPVDLTNLFLIADNAHTLCPFCVPKGRESAEGALYPTNVDLPEHIQDLSIEFDSLPRETVLHRKARLTALRTVAVMTNVVAIANRRPKKIGRPTLYSPELTARLLARLSGGLSLRAVCRHDDMPSKQAVLLWLGRYPEFMSQYLRAMEARGCACGEDVVDVTQRVLRGEIPPDAGRVAIQGLTWAAARMAPRAYGDRVAVTGHDGGAVKHQHTHELLAKATDDQLDVLERTVAQIEGIAVTGGDPGGEAASG